MQIKRKTIIRICLILIFQYAGYFCAFAGNDPIQTFPLLGSKDSVKVNYVSTVADYQNLLRIANPSLQPLIEPNTTHITNMVSVGIEEGNKSYIQTDFTVSVVLHIKKYDQSLNLSDEFDSTFTIDYKKADGEKYNAIQYLSFENAYKVEVKIVSITPDVTTWDVAKVLRVDNTLEVKRDYVFDCSKLIDSLSVNYDNINGELTASWGDPNNGQTEYDLEWAWIDSSAITDYQVNGQFLEDKVFSNNATRVTIDISSYNIPLLYDGGGKLFVRVRPAQIKSSGQRVEGEWTWINNATSQPVSFSYSGHQNNLNWQASTSYAEEGKRKSVVQYFDGTLRNRQTVTKDNTTGTTIVAESYYDYQGRPVIQVLPAPTLNTIIQYSENFNKSINFDGYPKWAYDKLDQGAAICGNPASPLSTSTGTAKYYSPANDLNTTGTGYNLAKYIPNSEGTVSGAAYPFAETRFNTDGRIAAQGGVGYTFQLGSGHETKYFYESPAQEELDALFGTDAGLAYHYFKNLVKDANGQYSVSYTDMHGRTIATALAGDAPGNLDSLISSNKKNFTKQLIDQETNRVTGKSIVSSKSLVVPKSGNYSFNYQLNPDQLKLVNCNSSEICYDCIYNLKITINADCNGVSGFPYSVVDSNFTVNGDLTSPVCNENGKTTGYFNKQFSVTLSEGAYNITKTLSLSDSAQNIYRDVFEKNDTCKQYTDFYNETYSALQSQSNCVVTCSACDSAIGDSAGFRLNFITESGLTEPLSDSMETAISAAYNEARANCDRICNITNTDGMENIRSIRQMMLMDVSPPNGQYASPDSSSAKYNIFNSGTELLTGEYQNESGQKEYPQYGGSIPTPSLFSDQFKTPWAEQLLPYHPEYCMLNVTLNQLPATYQFEADLKKLDSWTDMVAATPAAPGQYVANILDNDPFFSNTTGNAPGSAYYAAMHDSITSYVSLGHGHDYATLWQIAQSIVFCRNLDTTNGINSAQSVCLLQTPPTPAINPSTGCANDWNLVWQNFRNLYLAKREIFISKYLKDQCAGVTNSSLLEQGKTPRFIDFSDNTSINTNGEENENAFFDQVGSGSSQASQTGQALLANQYDSTCIGYANTWVSQLSECETLSTLWENQAIKTSDSTWIVDRLRDVCKNGSDQDHYLGSSSIDPSKLNSTVYHYTDFPSVIKQFFLDKGIPLSAAASCNPYLITIPKPYGQQALLTDMAVVTKPSDCECTQITNLSNEYHSSGYSGTFSDYLEQKYQTSVSQGALDTLLALCQGTYPCVFLPSPIILPPVLQCQNNQGSNSLSNACINCEQFQVVKDSFQLIYNHTAPIENPQTSDDSLWNNTFQAFANYKTGFSKSVEEYLDFMDSCSASISGNNNGNLTFIKTYSTSSDSSRTDLFYDTKRTGDGGFISVGITKKNSEKNDGLVVKKDEYGNVLWARKFGDAGEDVLSRIALTSDSGYIVTGSTDSYRDTTEAWVIKLDADGTQQWSKRYNAGTANGEYGRGIIQTSDGGYALISEYDYAPSYADWAVLKLNASGDIVWAKRFGSSSSDNAGSLIQDGDSLLVSALAYSTALDPGIPFSYYNGVVMKIGMNDGSVGWVKSYDIDIKSNWFYDIYKTDSGYILNTIMGDDWYATNPHSTMLRIDKNGNVKKIVRVNSFATSSSGYVSIFPTSDGGFVSAQDNNSANSDIFLQKTDSAGNPVWANKITLPGNQFITRLLENSDGTYTAEGMSDANALLIKTDTLGKTGCHDSTVTITNTFPTYSALNPTLAYNTTISMSENSMPNTGSILSINTTTVCGALPDRGPHLCGLNQPLFQKLDYQPVTCKDLDKIAYTAAEEKWQLYVDSVRNVFDTAYYNKCMSAKNLESFTVTYQTSEYHYTLYYYDQAGNLVKTVPPAGVDDKHGNTGFLDSVKVARADELINGPTDANRKVPNHTLVTEYRYNTLNQVVAQKTPDAGISYFWYDRLGRLVVSQNAKQSLSGLYSYTEYDDLGRIVQVGEKPQSTAMSQDISRNINGLDSWLNNTQDKEQITRTAYDLGYFAGEQPAALEPTLYQRNLRNRVSYTEVFDTEPQGSDDSKWAGTHTAATYYSYDIHGNVDTLVQDYHSGAMADAGNRFKKIVHDYDLISGKVNAVAYQPGQTDAFYHRYTYDAENRLTDVETSSDKLIWEKDGRYFYYKHGPLSRLILGQQQVQGLDYAYTLQGWLKGVNSSSVNASEDIGQDALPNGTMINAVAKDVIGFNLNYFAGDYKSIGGSTPFATKPSSLPGSSTGADLFNGNISSMAVNIPKLGASAQLYAYRYDQLNRIIAMDVFTGLNTTNNTWMPVASDNYKERVSYDANGNIQSYLRNGTTVGSTALAMDNMTYRYKPGTNQLDHVKDAVPATNYSIDIDNQDTLNYTYDQIGNLTKDASEGITNIEWTVYGKISNITKSDGTIINYSYDASGNRISKSVNGKETWYARDASGNVMSLYQKDPALNSGSLTQTEVHLYGSNRLGIYNLNNNVQHPDLNTGRIYTFTRGNKFFELSNHLGNVLVTVSDRKTLMLPDNQGCSPGTANDILNVSLRNGESNYVARQEVNLLDGFESATDDDFTAYIDNSLGTCAAIDPNNPPAGSYYMADVITANDYYPFGMLMPGRKYSIANTNYRYGFNGKENDNEVKGEGNQQNYGIRIYDSRSGKFLSVDPLTKNFPFYSPYHFAGNNPISNNDLDGGEPLDFKENWKWHNIFNPKSGASNGMNISVDDPKLGHVSVEGVYDNWTKQTWFIHQDNQGNFYYLKNLNGDNQTLRYTSDPSHELVGGQFEKFETQGDIQARLNSELADGIAIFFAGGITAIAAAPTAPILPSLGEATLATRGTSSLIDYGSQVGGNYIGGRGGMDAWINDINLTSLGLSFANPVNGVKSLAFNSIAGSAFSSTFSNGYNGLGGGKSLSTVGKESLVSFIAGSLTLGTDAKVSQLDGRLNHVQKLFGSSGNPLANSIQRVITKTKTIGNSIGVVSGTAANAINQ